MIIADNSMEALVCLKERIDNELENVREKSIELKQAVQRQNSSK